ncbi:TniQ family protein [Paenibacillus phytorum]|nr:TniQ family protein [Paenibacillus phytorum]
MLIRPLIQQNESLSGFLYRLQHMNGYASVSCIVSQLGLSASTSQNNEFSGKALEKLGELTLDEVEMYEKHNGYYLQNIFGVDLYTKIIMKNRVKYCPACIKENFFHRVIWNIIPIQMCYHHQNLMVDSCPKCGSQISLGTFMNQECNKCSFSFLDTHITITTNSIFLESQKQIIEGFRDNNFLVIDKCNLVQFFRLAYHSFHLLIEARDYTELSHDNLLFFHNRAKGEKSGMKMAIALANVYWMYLDFPNRFYVVLDDFLDRNKKMQRYGRLKGFESIFNDSTFLWLKESYVSYFIKQIDEGMVRKDFSIFKKEPELLLKRSRVRREEVRQDIGNGYDKLHELNDNKKHQIVTKLTKGKNIYLVEKSKIEDYLRIRENLISKKEVGLILGIRVKSVQKLVDSGYFTPIKIANSLKEMFNIHEAKEFMGKCKGSMVTIIEPSLISFHEALKKYPANSLTVVKIVEFTLSGQLKPQHLTHFGTFAENYYYEHDLQNCLQLIKMKRENDIGFVFNDVFKKLKIGDRRLWRILKEQDIQADFTLIMKNGRKKYYFKEETVLKIKEIISSSKGVKVN